MTKRKISLFACLALVICTLFSCTPEKDDGKENAGNNNQGTSESENVIYDNETEVTIVYNDTDIDPEILNNVAYSIMDVTSLPPSYASGDSAAGPHEIVLGATQRELSAKAYELLDSYILDKEEEFNLCYLIYTDGKSIAIAYEKHRVFGNFALSAACEYLVDKIIDDNSTLTLSAGTVYKATVDPIEAQRELDDIQLEAEWDALSQALEGYENAEEVISALQNYYTMFTDKMVLWYADLYDPVSGGFYYSNSARNTEGFLADIETTNQVMTFLRNSGMTDDPYGELTDEMRSAMIRFVKERQKPDGYFYHPQWEGMTYTVERLSRDLNWATSILKNLGATPTYTTPLGWEGDGKAADGTPVSKTAITGKMSTSCSQAVSKLVLTSGVSATAGVGDMFESRKSFSDYLDSLDLLANSYEVGNLIATLSARVVAEGYTDILTEWLDSQQNPENGLWYYKEPGDTGYSIYAGVNGLFKISAAYNTLRQPIPNAEAAIASAIEATVTDETPGTVCYFYNTWCSIYNVFYNLRTYSGLSADEADALIKPIQENLIKNAPEAIRITMEKAMMFRKDDGSYSMLVNNSAASAAGMPVAVPNTYEGDVNASNIAGVSVVTNMMAALGLPKVSIFTRADLLLFLAECDSLGEVIKDELFLEHPITFDKRSELPYGVTYNLLDDGELEIVENKAWGSDVLRFYTVNDGLHRSQSNLRFGITEASYDQDFEAFIFEADLNFTPGEGTGSSMHYVTFGAPTGTKFQVLIMCDLKNNVTVAQNLIGVEQGEWFRLRFEYFGKVQRDGAEVATVRVYVNGEYKFDITTTNKKYITPAVSELNGISFDYSTDNNRSCTLLLDNVAVTQGSLLEDRTNAEDFAEQLTFEHSSDTSLPAPLSSSLYGGSGLSVAELTDRGDSNLKALRYHAESGGGSTVNIAKTKYMPEGETYNAVALELDAYFESGDNADASYIYYFEFRASTGSLQEVLVQRSKQNVVMYIGGTWYTVGKVDTWCHLLFEYFEGKGGKSAINAYFDGKLIATAEGSKTANVAGVSSAGIIFSSSNKYAGDILVDNVSVYETNVKEVVANAEDEAETLTFEYSADDNLPALLTTSLQGDSKVAIADLVRGGASTKALAFIAEPAGGSNVSFKLMKTETEYDAVTFGADVFFATPTDTSKSIYYYPELRASSGSLASVTLRSYGGNIEIYLGGAWKKVGVTDAWYSLRFEYYANGDGIGAIRIFVDNEYVGDSVSSKSASLSNASTARFAYSSDNKVASTLYLDNVTLRHSTLTPIPGNDVDENGVYTFDIGDSEGLPTGVSYSQGGASAVSSAEVVYYDESRGNVLSFENVVDNAGVSGSNTKSFVRLLANGEFESGDTVVFKTEYKIESSDYADGVTSDSGESGIKYVGGASYRIQFVNPATGGVVCQLQYTFDKYGEAKLYQVASTGATSGAFTLPGGTFAAGNWIDLTLKVYNKSADGAETTCIDVIAVGLNKARTETVTLTTTYDLGTACDLSAIGAVQYYRYDSGICDSTLYFDNVYIGTEAVSEATE